MSLITQSDGVVQHVNLDKNTAYVLSFDAKANAGTMIMLGYHFRNGNAVLHQRWHNIAITNTFVRYSVQISTIDDDRLTGIYLMIGDL